MKNREVLLAYGMVKRTVKWLMLFSAVHRMTYPKKLQNAVQSVVLEHIGSQPFLKLTPLS